jgi:hypothetical protein
MLPRRHALCWIKLIKFIELQEKMDWPECCVLFAADSRSADAGAVYTQKLPHSRPQAIKVNDMAKNERTEGAHSRD